MFQTPFHISLFQLYWCWKRKDSSLLMRYSGTWPPIILRKRQILSIRNSWLIGSYFSFWKFSIDLAVYELSRISRAHRFCSLSRSFRWLWLQLLQIVQQYRNSDLMLHHGNTKHRTSAHEYQEIQGSFLSCGTTFPCHSWNNFVKLYHMLLFPGAVPTLTLKRSSLLAKHIRLRGFRWTCPKIFEMVKN